jgi:putative transcriptional regulator
MIYMLLAYRSMTHAHAAQRKTAAGESGLKSELRKLRGATAISNWEHGRRQPTGPAQVLLAMIARKPSVVTELLR